MNLAQAVPTLENEPAGLWLPLRRYLGALAFVGVAFLIRYWLSPVLGEELPFMFFIAASLLAAWRAGAAAGISALLLGLFLADYFFVRGHHPENWRNPMMALLIVRYLFTASLGIALIEFQHRARRRTEKALEEARREAALRKASQGALIEAQQQLREHTAQLETRVNERTAALRASVASLQDVLYNIAHHLRAPLRAMSGFSEILLEQYASRLDDHGRELAANISRAATRMDILAHDLLEYGRLAHIEIHLAPVNLSDAVKGAMAKLSQSLSAAHAEVLIPDSLPTLTTDQSLLEMALVELLDNALKFVQPGKPPIIRFHCEPQERTLRLWIEDNGVGIERRYHHRIFGVFDRLCLADSASTGIGLAIVKQVMQRLGGDAGVESEPGHGSRFWLDFPHFKSQPV